MDKVFVSAHNAVHNIVTTTNSGIEKEIVEHFKFRMPNYQYMPSFKRGIWDGYFRIYSAANNKLYVGLTDKLKGFCQERGYELVDETINSNEPLVTREELKAFVASLKIPFELYDYQISAVLEIINKKRILVLSPTGSGKSLIGYVATRWFNKRTLIIVPTTNLVEQLYSNFMDEYNCDINIHRIYSGKDKVSEDKVIISTWQSLQRLPKEWFAEFELIIMDEAHGATAKEMTKIMETMGHCDHRIGLTGSLDNLDINEYIIQGHFGPKFIVSTTAELIEQDYLSDFKIECIELEYDEEDAKQVYQLEYLKEMEFLINHTKRNQLVATLATGLKGNTLVLFRFTDHGKLLFDMISRSTNKNVYYIDGNVKTTNREEIRNIIRNGKDIILVASIQTIATGTDIKNLDNVIYGSPFKARIKILQSIGRVLRKYQDGMVATLYDIVDNLSYEGKPNIAMRHYYIRLKTYKEEKFTYKKRKISFIGRKK